MTLKMLGEAKASAAHSRGGADTGRKPPECEMETIGV